MPDVIKPGLPNNDGGADGGGEDEQGNGAETMDLMGSGRDFPLQVLMLVLVLLGWLHANGLPLCPC
ncbi:unnamed protein product [Ectocarpus sp. 8 AP-2014]